MRNRFCLLVTVVIIAACTGDGVAAEKNRAAFYTKLRSASVKILTNGQLAGSGSFVDPDGIVLTAAHVIRGKNRKIEVVSPGFGRMKGERLAVDFGHDLALLRVPKADKPFPTLKIAEKMSPPTDDVFLICSPLWRHDLLLKGTVARLAPTYCWSAGTKCFVECFYIAGASPIGSSGGSWVNGEGCIIGVQSGYLNNKDKSPVGIAYCSTTEAVKKLVSSRKDVQTASMNCVIEELWTQKPGFIARLPKGTGGPVTPIVHKGGAAEKAGFTNETIILEADGKPILYRDDLMKVVRAGKPGDKLKLKIIEPIGKPAREVEMKLGGITD